jgi:hypothetical protein
VTLAAKIHSSEQQFKKKPKITVKDNHESKLNPNFYQNKEIIIPPHPTRNDVGGDILDSACPSVRRPCCVFQTVFGLNRQIMKWNLVWLFTIMSYRSSLSFVIIDQILTELWVLGLRIFMKISVFRTFLELILKILKWNLVWLFRVMSYRSSLGFVFID